LNEPRNANVPKHNETFADIMATTISISMMNGIAPDRIFSRHSGRSPTIADYGTCDAHIVDTRERFQ